MADIPGFGDSAMFLEICMYRTRAFVALLIGALMASSCFSAAQGAGFLSRGAGGPLARLNRPLVPTLPGLPTASPLGLLAPRLSNTVSLFQLGGLRTPAGRLSGIGILSPRVSPLVALVSAPPKSRQARLMYGLTILSPRAAVLVGMLQASRGLTAGLR